MMAGEMPTERLQKILDRAFEWFTTTVEAWDKFYQDQVPVGHKALRRADKVAWWDGLPAEGKMATWQGWTDQEKQEFMKEVAPYLGGGESGP